MGIDPIAFYIGGLKCLAFQTIPLDSNRKPMMLGNGNPILFKVFFFDIIVGPKKEPHAFLVLVEFVLSLLDSSQILCHEVDEMAHIGLVDALPGRGFDHGVLDGESKFQCRHEAKGHHGCLFLPIVVKDSQARIGVGEIDPDFFLFLEIEFESVMLIFHSVLKEYLFYLTGVILHGFECRLHFLNYAKNSVFIRSL